MNRRIAWLRRVRDGYVARKYGKDYATRWYADMLTIVRNG